uniref:Acidic fibroblast growth factor intracellular-binding protein n=1 Tax=Strigamia maritima TaxID=126957 RepID=T1JE67_STRMM
MSSDVDIFVGNETIIDTEVYQLWLEGNTAQEAAAVLRQRGVLVETNASVELLMSDVVDHYRTYQMLERLLQNPTMLAGQWMFQVEPKDQRMLIEKYYEFDDVVLREILGKKLSSRNRKDLDEVSEKTNVSLKSCRRQFDNVKKVFKMVEDMRGSLVQNIQMHFLLPGHLAKKYAAIVFITNNRFETGKRKLQYLTFDDFLHCAKQMIAHWTTNLTEQANKNDETDVDLDREFLQDLRELKILLEKDHLEEHRGFVLRSLQGRLSDKMYQECESSFKFISRTVINIAYGLNHSRESRDIFVDYVEKVIEPCRQAKWSYSDLEVFLSAYLDTPQRMNIFKRCEKIKNGISLTRFSTIAAQITRSKREKSERQLAIAKKSSG